MTRTETTDLGLYTATAFRAARQVIRRYSTSFSWACRALPVDARRDVEAIYAMVRVADEVVDGAADESGASAARVRAALDAYEAACDDAVANGFSTDLVLHAFADVARRHGITRELTAPFFASMRADLSVAEHGEDSLAAYIHGSAEVVGLMCLQVFLDMDGTRAATEADRERLRQAASRLGAAFQKVNFLRDLGADHDALGRTYLPGAAPQTLTEERKAALLADLGADLDAALPGVLALDPRAGRAVLLAHALFSELARRIAGTPAAELGRRRVRVPDPVKAAIAARVLAASPVGIGRRGRPLPAEGAESDHGAAPVGGAPSASAAVPRRVVVVGGGFAGLATAGLLARDGHRVTLLEKNAELGGRSGRWSAEGFTFDTGPSWYLMPEVIDRWFRLMGSSAAEALDLRRLDPAYRVYFEEHLDEPPLDVVSGRASARGLFERLEPGAGARLDAYLDSARRIYTLAKRRFLYTDFPDVAGLARVDVLRALPSLGPGLLGSLAGHVAARFDDPRLRQVLGYPAVFLGTSPDRAPAMYHLMSHLDLDDGVQYPIGGFAALVDAMAALARGAGVEILTEAEVTGIEVDDDDEPRGRIAAAVARLPRPGEPHGADGRGRRAGRVRGVVHRDADGTERRTEADVVVAAADLHHVQTSLLPPAQRAAESTWDTRDPGPSAVLVCAGVRGRLPQLLHHTLLFTADWDDNFARIEAGEDLTEETSIYVSMTSATDPGVAPDGDEALFLLVPAPPETAGRPRWGRGGVRTPDVDAPGDPHVEAVADRALAQLARWAGIDDLAERIVVRRTWGPEDFVRDVHAWRGSLLGPGHTLAQSAMFRPPVRDGRVEGLLYAGSSVRPGIGVPMCLISAEIVREHVSGVPAGAGAEVPTS